MQQALEQAQNRTLHMASVYHSAPKTPLFQIWWPSWIVEEEDHVQTYTEICIFLAVATPRVSPAEDHKALILHMKASSEKSNPISQFMTSPTICVCEQLEVEALQ